MVFGETLAPPFGILRMIHISQPATQLPAGYLARLPPVFLPMDDLNDNIGRLTIESEDLGIDPVGETSTPQEQSTRFRWQQIIRVPFNPVVLGEHDSSSAPSWPATIQILPEGQLKALIYYHHIDTPVSGMVHCWTYVSQGLNRLRHKEVVFTLKRRVTAEAEHAFNTEPLAWFQCLYSFALEGKIVDNFQQTVFPSREFLGRCFSMIIYCPVGIVENVPEQYLPEERLHAILLTDSEAQVAMRCGTMRALSHLGMSERWFPYPLWIDRDRRDSITMADMQGTIRNDFSFVSVLEVSAIRRGSDITLFVPKRAEKYIKEVLHKMPPGCGLPLDSFMYGGSDSGLMWKNRDTTPSGYSAGNSDTCMNLGFIIFCPGQEANEWQLTEDGYICE